VVAKADINLDLGPRQLEIIETINRYRASQANSGLALRFLLNGDDLLGFA
jgi:hypothetical protein